MIDLSKCSGKDCAKKELCVRYLHPARSKFQAWLVEAVAIPVKSECVFFAETIEEVVSK